MSPLFFPHHGEAGVRGLEMGGEWALVLVLPGQEELELWRCQHWEALMVLHTHAGLRVQGPS